MEKREKAVEEVRWMQEVLKRQLEEEARLVTKLVNPEPDPHVFGPPGSGSMSQRYGSADPDPHQNFTDP